MVEIGPGRGILTDLLLESAGSYVGIEIDPRLTAMLRERFSRHGHFELIEEDILAVDWEALIQRYGGRRVIIVGNIPYNITSPILFNLFEQSERLDRAVLMVQKEVARRLTAISATRDYGLLAINSQLFSEITYLFTVPSKLFYPQPKVDSGVVKMYFKKGVRERFPDFLLFRRVLRHCFQYRRKMLRKSLSMLFSQALLSKLSADLTRRPADLSIPEWKDLVENIYRQLQKEMD